MLSTVLKPARFIVSSYNDNVSFLKFACYTVVTIVLNYYYNVTDSCPSVLQRDYSYRPLETDHHPSHSQAAECKILIDWPDSESLY